MASRVPLAGVILMIAATAAAQEAHPSAIAIDTSAETDEAIDQNGNRATGVLLDAVVSLGLGHGFEAITRPFVQRLATTGEWNTQVWVAALRYERPGPIGVRVDGGLIPSPVGYSNLMLRPHLNPTITPPISMFLPLPAAEPAGPRATLLGALYPMGVNATASSPWWDARIAVTDTSPLRPRRVFASDDSGFRNPPRFTNLAVGGGITPTIGLRIGASFTRGGWLKAGESATNAVDRTATVVTVETEYSVRYTKVAGEWTHDALATSNGNIRASGWYVQGQQTLAPRWFAAARVEHMDAPVLVVASSTFAPLDYNGTEEVIGFRLTPGITIRAGHRAREPFGAPSYLHAATMSVVWWQRWK
ncbi:MAG TPA: hypothetical protein VL173_05950 [Vicinamibacterales bacterium]|nr:hypothetical protein [Vicinamibacterales bacterium]